MKIPYTTDGSGGIVPDLSAIPPEKRDQVAVIRYVPEDQEYEVEFDSSARIAELEAKIEQLTGGQQ